MAFSYISDTDNGVQFQGENKSLFEKYRITSLPL